LTMEMFRASAVSEYPTNDDPSEPGIKTGHDAHHKARCLYYDRSLLVGSCK